jgi:hypothetical protein
MKLPISFPTLRYDGPDPSLRLVMRSIIEMFQRIAGAFNNPEFGTTANRPVAVPGFPLVTGQIDETLGQPIWYRASVSQWVDAMGTLGAASYTATPHTWSANQQFNSGNFLLKGSTSGTLTVKPPAVAGSNTITLPAGTTDFSATGGTNQFVKQASAGSAFTVGKPSSAITGTTTNNNATAGDIGEEVEGVVLQASAITLASGTAANITSISLPAGDWDVEGDFALNKAAGSTTQYEAACISITSLTFPAPGSFGRSDQLAAMFDNFPFSFPIGKVRLSLASTTTVYLVGYCIFSGTGAVTAWGGIIARRVR